MFILPAATTDILTCMDLTLLVVLTLAVYRVTLLIVEDKITERLRDFVFLRFPPENGSDFVYQNARKIDGKWEFDSQRVRNSSIIGELLSCSYCVSVWATAAIFSLYLYGGHVGGWIVYAAAIAGAARLLFGAMNRIEE